MGSEHYCLRWNNHQSNLLGVFSQLLQDESLVDVTLACDGHSVRAHKVVLSACSSYFQSLFTDHPDRHPIVILKDMKYSELKILLEFMYKGEVNVEYSQLGTLLKTAESLQVKGLAEMTGQQTREGTNQAQSETPTPSSSTNPANQTHPENMAAAASTRPPLPPQPQTVQAPSQTASAPVAEKHVPEDLSHDLHAMSPTSHAKRLRLRPDSAESSDDGEDSLAMDDVSSMPSDTPTPMPSSPRSAEPLPGPSGMLSQIQQVPLSLKKESDWNRPTGDERSTGESSSDFRDLPDQNLLEAEVQIIEGSFASPATSHSKDDDEGSSSNPDQSDHSASQSLPGGGPPMGPPMPFGFPFGNLAALSQYAMTTESAAKDSALLALLQQEQLSRFLMGQGMESRAAAAANNATAAAFMEQAMAASGVVASSSSSSNNAPLSPGSHSAGEDVGSPTCSTTAPKCHVCLAYFPTTSLMEQHMELHAREKPYKCEQCGQCYKYQSAYFKHKEQNHMARLPGEKPFHCDLCGMQFKYLKSFKKHRLNHTLERLHTKDVIAVKRESFLSDCENGSGEEASDEGMSGSETPGPSPCHTSSSNGSRAGSSGNNHPHHDGHPFSANPLDLYHHRPNSSNSHLHSAMLADCSVTSNLSHNNNPLVSSTTGNDPSSNKAAEQQQSQLHLQAPRNTPDLQAAIAESSSLLAALTAAATQGIINPTGRPHSTMSAQTNQHHHHQGGVGRPERPASCMALPSTSTDAYMRPPSAMSPLINLLHGDNFVNGFICPFCHKAFRTKENLKLHVRKHTGERPFPCEFCGRAFGGKSDLTRHMRTHTGERPYHCFACGKNFARADYLSKHLTTHS